MKSEIVKIDGQCYTKVTEITSALVIILRNFGAGFSAMEAAENWMRSLSCSDAVAYAKANPLH